MSNSDKKILITDTSVLINFLHIDRLDLLSMFPGKFVITEHVIEEVTADFPDQQSILRIAISNSLLEVVSVNGEVELNLYNELIKEGRLGSGECSAIACAISRKLSLLIDDSRACKQAMKLKPSIEILKTQDILITLINDGAITIEEADLIKLEWQVNYRFSLKFGSFREVIALKQNA